MLNDRLWGEKKTQREESPSQNQAGNQRPHQSLEVGRSLRGRAPVTCGQAKLPQPRCEAGSCARGACRVALPWGQALSVPPCPASMAQVPSPVLQGVSKVLTECLPERWHKGPPHAQRAAAALLCQGQWEFVHWMVQAGFPPTDTHLLPDACACEYLCVYIHFKV